MLQIRLLGVFQSLKLHTETDREFSQNTHKQEPLKCLSQKVDAERSPRETGLILTSTQQAARRGHFKGFRVPALGGCIHVPGKETVSVGGRLSLGATALLRCGSCHQHEYAHRNRKPPRARSLWCWDFKERQRLKAHEGDRMYKRKQLEDTYYFDFFNVTFPP